LIDATPEEWTDVAELMRITGWKRTKLYQHLRQHAEAPGNPGQRRTLADADPENRAP
jgi:hypothetical protein